MPPPAVTKFALLFFALSTLPLTLPLAGCTPDARRTELYFGLSKPAEAGGTTISEEEFQQFLESEVTPRFPDGYTILPAQGFWRSPAGPTTRESSRVLVLYRPPGDTPNRQIEAIRAAYKSRFHQESVLRIETRAKGSF
jgi:hypothetical protein